VAFAVHAPIRLSAVWFVLTLGCSGPADGDGRGAAGGNASAGSTNGGSSSGGSQGITGGTTGTGAAAGQTGGGSTTGGTGATGNAGSTNGGSDGGTGGTPTFTTAPANPNATTNTRSVLEYLSNLPTGESNRIVSGEFLGAQGDGGSAVSLSDVEGLHDKTGQWVGLIGADYFGWTAGQASSEVVDNVNSFLTDYWNAGGLVAMEMHVYNPFTGGHSWDTGSVDLVALITEGNEVNTAWMAELDRIAAGIQKLQDAGVVLLWRPFHELNGGWFWWGNRDATQFQNVYKHMFDYFTDVKQLNNVLWVYNVWVGSGNITAYYPGPEYVDIVSLDGYSNGIAGWAGDYDQLQTLGKPFAIAELGSGSALGGGDANYDLSGFIADIKSTLPNTSYWMQWENTWSMNNGNNPSGLLNDDWVVNRDELPEW
jgi:mannan endo-1,4-beta-mannosidase